MKEKGKYKVEEDFTEITEVFSSRKQPNSPSELRDTGTYMCKLTLEKSMKRNSLSKFSIVDHRSVRISLLHVHLE